MAVRHPEAVQQLSSEIRRVESCPGMIGPISLDMKRMGARSAGNPHAACDVEGAGNVARSNSSAKPARQSSTLPVRGGGDNVPTYSALGLPDRRQVAPERRRLMEMTMFGEEVQCTGG